MRCFLLLPFILSGLAAPTARADDVVYLREIKPLLAKRCVACHGEARPRGGLRLDTAALALQGGKHGPAIVAGDAEQSDLLALVSEDAGAGRMPLKRPPLSPGEIDLLRRWIEQGANAPENETPTRLSETHWAFLPPQRPAVPGVSDPEWAGHPIDAFIRARLDAEGLTPSVEADRSTLLRRVTLDLTGLPPTPKELGEFQNDIRPNAYERVVDRLLASPRYGERWARPWLDLSRYADSNGYSIDAPRTIWKYRDWVIDALNRDLPFDAFLTDQLAGDLRPEVTLDQRVATGFHRNTQINEEGGIDPEQFRVEAIADRVNTTASVFLGLTIGCAQCHDHKYDPISQREYYNLFAFFNSVDEPEIELATSEELQERDRVRAEIDAFLDRLKSDHPELQHKLRDWEAQLDPAFKVSQPSETKKTFDVKIEDRTERQNRLILQLYVREAPEFANERSALDALRRNEKVFVSSLVVKERATPRPTFVHVAGDFTRQGEPVEPDVPAVLPPLQRESSRPTRLDLARWLVAPEHPMTARVAVNRIWQAVFGTGLVETENDFGTQGATPSHPELLDWLATELVARDWSLKAMHRTIATSRTYRQASSLRPELLQRDPANRLLARQSRLRLEAEVIRDVTLATAGLLTDKLGGPSVFPPQPDGVMGLGQVKRVWTVSQGSDRYRRGLYTFFWRSSPYPALTVFDAPNAVQACTRRVRSNTPVQALTLLNDAAFYEAAQALAERILNELPGDDRSRIDPMFRLCLGRGASGSETDALLRLLSKERADGGSLASAWTAVSRVIFNLDEFITRE
jgi:mono/diheme cytochrome c family protein